VSADPWEERWLPEETERRRDPLALGVLLGLAVYLVTFWALVLWAFWALGVY
jgi:hypothetical protein